MVQRQLINPMEQNPFIDANSHSANEEIPVFRESEISLSLSRKNVTGPSPDPDEPHPQLPAYISKIHSNIILSKTVLQIVPSLRFDDQNFL
jgi:hypothetical protein